MNNLKQENDILIGLVIKFAVRNRVLGLLHNNLPNANILDDMPIYYAQILDDFGDCNLLRNNNKLTELSQLQIAAKENRVLLPPIKGGYLIDDVYKNRKLRATNDIDVLIKRKDIQAIHDIMIINGYTQGDYDKASNTVLAVDKNKKMIYKTKIYNLLPYVKVDQSNPNNTVFFDLSFALDFS